MSSKQCEKCGEPVDDAKAFCPGCGHAFVAEHERIETSEFESQGRTVQMGQTMYNAMLSDLGLNISGAPGRADKSVENVNAVPTQIETPDNIAKKPLMSRKWLWIAVGVVIFLVLTVLAAAAVVFLYYFFGRF